MAGSDDEREGREAEEQAQREAEEQAQRDAAELARLRAIALASTRATLHAQAIAVQSIKTLVPIVLDVETGNYSRGSNLILNTLSKYALDDHVLSDAGDSDDEQWVRLDCTVKSWLYGTISLDLYELVMNRKSSARSVWLGLEEQFLGNKEARALYLDAAFRNFVQGDLSISDYCRKLKGMADSLGDLGEQVHDRTLVLNVLRGLNDKFAYMVPHFRRQRPFPSFIQLRADLLLEEITMTNRSSSGASAFVAGTHSSGSSISLTLISFAGGNSVMLPGRNTGAGSIWPSSDGSTFGPSLHVRSDNIVGAQWQQHLLHVCSQMEVSKVCTGLRCPVIVVARVVIAPFLGHIPCF